MGRQPLATCGLVWRAVNRLLLAQQPNIMLVKHTQQTVWNLYMLSALVQVATCQFACILRQACQDGLDSATVWSLRTHGSATSTYGQGRRTRASVRVVLAGLQPAAVHGLATIRWLSVIDQLQRKLVRCDDCSVVAALWHCTGGTILLCGTVAASAMAQQ
jgi:hypothetical protein